MSWSMFRPLLVIIHFPWSAGEKDEYMIERRNRQQG